MANDKNVYAAIALAIHEHLGNNVHDAESCVITINERNTQWNGFALRMTERP